MIKQTRKRERVLNSQSFDEDNPTKLPRLNETKLATQSELRDLTLNVFINRNEFEVLKPQNNSPYEIGYSPEHYEYEKWFTLSIEMCNTFYYIRTFYLFVFEKNLFIHKNCRVTRIMRRINNYNTTILTMKIFQSIVMLLTRDDFLRTFIQMRFFPKVFVKVLHEIEEAGKFCSSLRMEFSGKMNEFHDRIINESIISLSGFFEMFYSLLYRNLPFADANSILSEILNYLNIKIENYYLTSETFSKQITVHSKDPRLTLNKYKILKSVRYNLKQSLKNSSINSNRTDIDEYDQINRRLLWIKEPG